MAVQGLRITAAVFDLGNVVGGWNPYLPLADRLSLSEWQEFAGAADFIGLNAMSDLGVPVREVVRCASEKKVDYGELMERYYERFDEALTGPIPGVGEIIDELKVTGLRVLGLTNWSNETFHHGPQSAPVIHRLEAVVVSGREGLAKPDTRLFQRLIDLHGLVPQRTVFIDDSERNVEAARALGLIGLRFADACGLRADLQRLGVLSPE